MANRHWQGRWSAIWKRALVVAPIAVSACAATPEAAMVQTAEAGLSYLQAKRAYLERMTALKLWPSDANASIVVLEGVEHDIGTLVDPRNLWHARSEACVPAEARMPRWRALAEFPGTERKPQFNLGVSPPLALGDALQKAEVNGKLQRTASFQLSRPELRSLADDALEELVRAEACVKARAGRDAWIVRGVIRAQERFVLETTGDIGGSVGGAVVGTLNASFADGRRWHLEDAAPRAKFLVLTNVQAPRSAGARATFDALAPEDIEALEASIRTQRR